MTIFENSEIATAVVVRYIGPGETENNHENPS